MHQDLSRAVNKKRRLSILAAEHGILIRRIIAARTIGPSPRGIADSFQRNN